MKKEIFVSAIVLGTSMFVAAQQAPSASTPPTFPSDQSQQSSPAQRSTMPPDTSSPTATPQSTAPDTSAPASQSDQGSSSGKAQTIQGCISQDTGMNGGFVLTDDSGTKYSLAGDSSKFSSFVGQEVKVKGSAAASSSSMSSSSSADQSSSASAAKPQDQSSASSQGANAPASSSSSAAGQQQLTVQSVKKIADTCSAAPAAK